ncbi:MAG: hypothetical protein C6Y22_10800 [Hapalosiphonaceae cyanobacterium JJU2]|nr:MAG: hypothetical protein C6Y22_10800 [Hapalosiphonaceae cyanobacterium JJU2]
MPVELQLTLFKSGCNLNVCIQQFWQVPVSFPREKLETSSENRRFLIVYGLKLVVHQIVPIL